MDANALELKRKETLLKELHHKNKVGGVVDRRFGENDPTMTPEQRAAERFAREKQKKSRKESMFNLEEDEEETPLTHFGESLFGQERDGDDFQEDDLTDPDADSDSGERAKRKRVVEEDDMDGQASESEEEQQPERKKSKKEVMEEIIAKSKLRKYEKQKAKEDDDELRSTLDKGLPDIFEMVSGTKRPEPEPRPVMDSIDPGRAALMNGMDRDTANRDYDQRLKQMTFDKRSKPSDRTKTDEEKAEEEAERLKQLEEQRVKRMRGEQGDDESGAEGEPDDEADNQSEPDDARQFGLSQPNEEPELDVEDEDDFIIDEDLVEMDSVADLSLSDNENNESASADGEGAGEGEDLEDDEFISGLSLPADKNAAPYRVSQSTGADADGVAYTYPCPENHEQFLETVQDVKIDNLLTAVQRIRALHHPRLHADNKGKLEVFSGVLVEHIAYLANQDTNPPFTVLENLLRHIHSLAKSYPEAVTLAFRRHLRDMADDRPLNLIPGDLITLTGAATIFPTSDHFHPVVTPAILSMGRYLGQSTIENLGDLARGAYIGSLCLQHQTLARRYIPEFMNYVLNALCVLSPSEPKSSLGYFPFRKSWQPLKLAAFKQSSLDARKLSFGDIAAPQPESKEEQEILKLSLISTFVSLLDTAADLWTGNSAFFEIFNPARQVLKHVRTTSAKVASSAVLDKIQHTTHKLDHLLSQAKRSRRPLLLHSHRPLAIKMAIPKFEDSYNPERRYDPDRERAELGKLKAEHKRERKGAMRELRKDANFVARENLRGKRESDAEYEKKYRRLVAEVQGEEGREANAYEKEKKARQGKK